MTSPSITYTPSAEDTTFQTGQALPIVGAHLIHDIYTGCVAPLLPVLIEKLSMSLTLAGSLTAIMQIPAVINPFIGYLADRLSVRYFIILAPAVTATAISLIGFAPSYFSLAVLLFTAGVSTACFHAPAPAMIGRVSGNRVGLGMSLFMAGGELAYTIGPLLAVWAVSTWTLDGFWRIVVLGWAASLILYWRLRDVKPRLEKPMGLPALLPGLTSLFIPMALVSLFRNPLLECLSTYLPTYMKTGGASLVIAGASLSVVQFAGFFGVLLSGSLSDRLGRKAVLLVSTLIGSFLMLAFINAEGWLILPVLVGLGLSALSAAPILLAIVQEQFPRNRAVANGLFMMTVFLLRPTGTLFIGALGDRFGLETAFFWGALIYLLAVLPILALPERKAAQGTY